MSAEMQAIRSELVEAHRNLAQIAEYPNGGDPEGAADDEIFLFDSLPEADKLRILRLIVEISKLADDHATMGKKYVELIEAMAPHIGVIEKRRERLELDDIISESLESARAAEAA